jgi:hypothetical protein
MKATIHAQDRVITSNGKCYEVINVRSGVHNLNIVDCKAIKPDGSARKAKDKSFLVNGNAIVCEVNY